MVLYDTRMTAQVLAESMVRFIYVDESHDATKFCLTGIVIRHVDWRDCFELVRAHRLGLKASHGFYVRREIHARDLVSGRGDIATTTVSKWARSRVFLGLLQLVARLPNVELFNVCLDVGRHSDPQLTAWDRLVNRIERTMLAKENSEIPRRRKWIEDVRPHLDDSDARAVEERLLAYRARSVIVADEGREAEITKALRRMQVFNPIPSRFGAWSAGERARNIPTERIIEDPVFKDSKRSFFLQLADCVAFALLKREVPPTPLVARYGIHKMFDQTLPGICFRKASLGDPLGIVRT